jgi:hypothetical protein
MTHSIEIQPHWIIKPNGFGVNNLFKDILFEAALHKFGKDVLLSTPFNNQMVTDSIFELGSRDTLRIMNRFCSGQQIQELFCVLPLLKVAQQKYQGKQIYVSFPETNSPVDIQLLVCDEGAGNEINGRRSFRGEDGVHLINIQVKEDVEYLNGNVVSTKSDPNYSVWKKYAENYEETLVIFSRRHAKLQDECVQKILSIKNDIWIITMPTNCIVGGQIIEMKKGKYNFVLLHQEMAIHNWFDPPEEFTPMTQQ